VSGLRFEALAAPADLHRRLSRLDPTLVDREDLDPIDAHEVLARHLGQLARQALRFVGGPDAAALARQVDLANRIARAIAGAVPQVAGDDDLISPPGNILQAVATGGVWRKKPRDFPGCGCPVDP
jgi:hypothetical protein